MYLKDMTEPKHTEVVSEKKVASRYKKKNVILKIHQVIWYICWVIEITLIIRTALKLLGANPESPFVGFLYEFSNIFAYPFLTMFPTTIVGKSEFEWSIYFAAIIYILAAWLVVTLIKLAKPETNEEIDENL